MQKQEWKVGIILINIHLLPSKLPNLINDIPTTFPKVYMKIIKFFHQINIMGE